MNLDKNQDERFRKVIADHLEVSQESVTDEAHIKDDLGGDSLDVVEIVIELEKEFDCQIPDQVVAEMEFTTVGEFKQVLENILI